MLGDITVVENIYIACGYTDMRKSIDGLAVIVQEQFSWILFRKAFFCSVENAGTGSNVFCGKGMVFCSYTNVWRTAVSNGRAKKAK